ISVGVRFVLVDDRDRVEALPLFRLRLEVDRAAIAHGTAAEEPSGPSYNYDCRLSVLTRHDPLAFAVDAAIRSDGCRVSHHASGFDAEEPAGCLDGYLDLRTPFAWEHPTHDHLSSLPPRRPSDVVDVVHTLREVVRVKHQCCTIAPARRKGSSSVVDLQS